MTIYVVMLSGDECDYIETVFATREMAEQYVNGSRDYGIEEYEVLTELPAVLPRRQSEGERDAIAGTVGIVGDAAHPVPVGDCGRYSCRHPRDAHRKGAVSRCDRCSCSEWLSTDLPLDVVTVGG